MIEACLPSPAIRAGPQTTYITSPLDAEGNPDYARYMDDRQRQGEQLIPEFLPELPIDVFSDQPLSITGVRKLYSVFNNGVDDGGDHFDGSIIDGEWSLNEDVLVGWDKSDMVIRIPQPELAPLNIDAVKQMYEVGDQ